MSDLDCRVRPAGGRTVIGKKYGAFIPLAALGDRQCSRRCPHRARGMTVGLQTARGNLCYVDLRSLLVLGQRPAQAEQERSGRSFLSRMKISPHACTRADCRVRPAGGRTVIGKKYGAFIPLAALGDRKPERTLQLLQAQPMTWS